MSLSEAEMQILAVLYASESENGSSDRVTLEKDGDERYWIYKVDWSAAFAGLAENNLIEGDDSGYRLTVVGRPQARRCNEERPDRMYYHYLRFWKAAFESKAHTLLCERVFGKDLCQDGMVDIEALADVIEKLHLGQGDRLLDLGCGAGMITEYVSDLTGAQVVGLEYAPEAVKVAQNRTAEKQDRLSFVQGDMNALVLEPNSFDAVMSLDTLYWAVDLQATMAKLVESVKPGGQICVFMMQGPWDDDPPGQVLAEETALGQVLTALGLSFEAHDYTAKNVAFWQRNYQAAVDLLDMFESEGNGFIAQGLIKEAEEEFLPAIKADKMTRYLYQIWP